MRMNTSVLQIFARTGHSIRAWTVLLLLLAPYTHAEQLTGTVSHVVVSTDGQSCPIKLSDPYEGRLTQSGYTLLGLPFQRMGVDTLSIFLKCLNSNDEEHIKHTVSAVYDDTQHRWKRDVSWLSAEERRVTQIFPLHGINSSGIGMTSDAINGDPKTRDRAFTFCLRHPPVVLCGSTPQIARPYYNKTGSLQYALTIVKSIEFVDVPVAASVDTSSSPDKSGR
jgi:hypothetical protein